MSSGEANVSSKANSLTSNGSVRWVLIGIGVLVIVGLSLYLLLRAADTSLNSLNEAKKTRTTTAVVRAKNIFVSTRRTIRT
jgi:hypothetical protein